MSRAFRRNFAPLVVVAGGTVALLLCISCSRQAPPSSLVVFAAASTTDAVKAITAAYQEKSGERVYCNFASSAALAQQIQAGADADLFFSANRQWVEELVNKGLTSDVVELATNSLVVVVPRRSHLSASDPKDLLSNRFRTISIGQPDSVPAGIYAKQALTRLGLWEDLKPKLVFCFDVRQVLAYVERGEADAGFVYATDAEISSDVRTAFSLGSDLTEPIRYPLVLLRGAREGASDLFGFFSAPEATEILRRYGFQPLSPAVVQNQESKIENRQSAIGNPKSSVVAIRISVLKRLSVRCLRERNGMRSASASGWPPGL